MGEPDGSQILRAEVRGKLEDAESLGVTLAQNLISQGANRILASIQD